MEDVESYIKDFDILWNRTENSETQALVCLFIGGFKVGNKTFSEKIRT